VKKPALRPSENAAAPLLHLPGDPPPSPRQWLVAGLLPAGSLALMFGEPKSGKSTIAMALASHIALGRSVAGRRVNEGAVLWIAGERGHDAIDRRDVYAGLHPRIAIGISRSAPDLSQNTAGQTIIDMAVQLEVRTGLPTKLIVIDTLARCFSGNENDAGGIKPLIDQIDRVRQETGATVLLLHHATKPMDMGRGPTRLRARGSTALTGAMDVGLVVSKTTLGARMMADASNVSATGGKLDFVFEEHEIAGAQSGLAISHLTIAIPASDADPDAPEARRPDRTLSSREEKAIAELRKMGEVIPKLEALAQLRKSGIFQGKPPASRMAFLRMVEKLSEFDIIRIENETIRLVA
jgi:RecA/RadA recombinase